MPNTLHYGRSRLLWLGPACQRISVSCDPLKASTPGLAIMLRFTHLWAVSAPSPRAATLEEILGPCLISTSLINNLAFAPACCVENCRDQFVWSAALLTWCGGRSAPPPPRIVPCQCSTALIAVLKERTHSPLPERAWVDAPSPARVWALHALDLRNGARRPIVFLSV